MKTKFLTPNYFTTANQILDFLRLPLPSIQTPLSFSFSIFDHHLPRCSDSASIDDHLHLHNLPIDNALSQFFADVLPHTVDLVTADFPSEIGFRNHRDLVSEKGDDSAYDDSATVCQPTSPVAHDEFSVERIQNSTGDNGKNGPVILQFEIPELRQHVENACFSVGEEIQFLSEVQECDDNLEMPNTGLLDPYQDNRKDCVETVDDVCLESDIERKLHVPEEISPLLSNVHTCHNLYPLLEVDEIGMDDTVRHCLEFELLTLIENVELQQCAENEDLEQLGAVEIDILEHVDHTSKLPLACHVENLNLALEIDILHIVETSYIERSTGTINAYMSPSPETFLFEELEFFDISPFEIFEAHSIGHMMKEPETCQQLFHRDINFKSFDELIVSHELTIIDGTFTSLPVPVFLDDDKCSSLHVMIVDIFSKLEPVSVSASDEIYLDWHLLGVDKCNVTAAIEKVFGEVEEFAVDSNLKCDDGSLLVLNFLLSDEPMDRLRMKENKLDITSGGSCTSEHQNTGVPLSMSSDDDCQIIEHTDKRTRAGSKKVELRKSPGDFCPTIDIDGVVGGDLGKVDSYVESASHFNDLDFFLNPTKGASRMAIDRQVKELTDKLDSDPFYKNVAAPLNVSQMQKSAIQLHIVKLPDNFRILMDNLRKSYLAVFKDDTQLNEIEISIDRSNDIDFLRLSEERLADHMSKLSKQKNCMSNIDDRIMNLVTLCAIKRMAWCLSFCGIQSLHHFVCKLFESMDCLKSRLCFLHSLIDDAYRMVDNDITNSHPSLAIIKDILQQVGTRKYKVLIVSLKFFWGPLRRLLSSMNISFTEVEDLSVQENQQDLCSVSFGVGARDNLPTACLLLPLENISSSILKQKFDIILEYGGPSGVSKVSPVYSEHMASGCGTLHFLKLELDDVAKALTEGVIVTSTNRERTKLEDLWNFGPVIENFCLVSSEAAGRTNFGSIHKPVCQIFRESEPSQLRQPESESFPDMMVVVNTQSSNKEMIISRRSTYQKILSMEKKGGQVVERDLVLPVDIVVDATMCIAWYNNNNIRMKATAEDEGSSSVPLCIENVAENVLTSLSFTFTSCLLVFEGESNFLGTVMESADELYAAAASLGINLQVLCSYSFDQTDEIISSSIQNAMKFSRCLLPRLPESETLAESFLTKFPSINPLSAHAIIYSGCTLLEFFELSEESRIHALKKFHVPDESINLFTVLCKYGEREDSKSGLTDCSSSVSSPRDSAGKFVCRISSLDRKRKLVPDSSDAMHDFRCSRQSRDYRDEEWGGRNMQRPLDDSLSKSPRKCPEKAVYDLLGNDLFGQGNVSDTGTNKDAYHASKFWCKPDVNGAPKIPPKGAGFAQASMVSEDCLFDQEISGMTKRNNRQQHEGDILEDPLEHFIGEVVDIYDEPFKGGNFQSDDKAKSSSPFIRKMENDNNPIFNRTARRLSFGTGCYPDYSMADEMNMRGGLESNRQYDDCNGLDYTWSNNNFKPQKGPIGVNFMEKDTPNVRFPLSKEELYAYGETPLSKAINVAQAQQGSPWTIEFLNRIKEKRKLRQQHQPCIPSDYRASYHGNMNKFKKKRSPSILEYYKYEGGSTPRKPAGQKRQKHLAQTQNETPSRNFPTWTPTDKKARRTLSFATNGTGSQTKLVWRDDISCSSDRRFYN